MDTIFLVLTIVLASGIETWHERTALAAVCHGRALVLAQKAAARGWSIRYSCSKSIVGERLPREAGLIDAKSRLGRLRTLVTH